MKTSENREPQVPPIAENILKFLENLVIITWHGIGPFLESVIRTPVKAIVTLGMAYTGIYEMTARAFHLRFMAWIWPSLFSGKFLHWLYTFKAGPQTNAISIALVYGYILYLGARAMLEERRIRTMFESIGLTNRFGQTPTIIQRAQLDEFRESLLLNAMSIGIDQFENKKESLEAALGKTIESITRPNNVRNVEIILTTKAMPSFVSFMDLLKYSPLKEGSFYLGESRQGIETAKLENLPHALIAGTTGAGKSMFFKQTILGLLCSSSNLQVYFIDLKRGLEAADFKSAPNIAIAKGADEALSFLEQIHEEMEKRFQFLEKTGFKSINPKRDRLDRIVVAVDEAAELYADKSKLDPDYETTINAQKLTNSIARLGRAAGIHLILATQKVTKESINTIIQENISMRVCFKLNTLQGSLQVLGSKDAIDLPAIPGRAIYQFGGTQVQIQGPHVTDLQVRSICDGLAQDFSSGKKAIAQKMIANTHVQNLTPAKPSGLIDLDA